MHTYEAVCMQNINGNGGLSLAEVDKAIVELFPKYDFKPALMQAFKAADRDGNGFVTWVPMRLRDASCAYSLNTKAWSA
jgi:hypothetical protein